MKGKYYIADDNGTIHADNIDTETIAAGIMEDIIAQYTERGEAVPEGLEVMSEEDENGSIKYELYTDTFEFRFGRTKESIPAMSARDIQEAYEAQTANDPHLVASFDTEEEARAALAEMSGSTRPQASNVFWLLCGSVAWIEENEYDADGEFVQNLSWVDFLAEPYTPDGEEDE